MAGICIKNIEIEGKLGKKNKREAGIPAAVCTETNPKGMAGCKKQVSVISWDSELPWPG